MWVVPRQIRKTSGRPTTITAWGRPKGYFFCLPGTPLTATFARWIRILSQKLAETPFSRFFAALQLPHSMLGDLLTLKCSPKKWFLILEFRVYYVDSENLNLLNQLWFPLFQNVIGIFEYLYFSWKILTLKFFLSAWIFQSRVAKPSKNSPSYVSKNVEL